MEKEFGEAQGRREKQTYTWSNRQNEWYNAERRFIYACRNEPERRQWLKQIRKAVRDNENRIGKEEVEVEDLESEKMSGKKIR